MTKLHKISAVLVIFAMLLSLAGCLGISVDDLYSLPEFSDEYLKLQELLDKEIASGCTYYSPTSGNYRSAVQFFDIDGDGSDEATAFFLTSEQTLKICVYHPVDYDYILSSTISGDGSAIGSVEYSDMDGDNISELIVAWQISSDLRMLKVYSMVDWSASVLLTAECTQFLVADMDGNGRSELLSLHFSPSSACSAEMFSISQNSEPARSAAKMSSGLRSLDRLRTGYLSDGTIAVFAESSAEDGQILTDIFIASDGGLKNITYNDAYSVNRTARSYPVYCTDIDGDRCMEIPDTTALKPQSDSPNTYWVFDWYAYSPSGARTLKFSTYHCYSDGWYLILPDGLRDSLTVRRADTDSGERVVILSSIDAHGQITDLLAIYTLSGDNRSELAKLSGRFTLAAEEDAIYAGRILNSSISEDEIMDNFRLIYTEWITGAI